VGPIQAVMWLGYEADHSSPSSTEVNNVWSFTFIPLIHTGKKSLNTYTGKFNIKVLINSISVQLFTIIVPCISGTLRYITLLF